MNIACMSWLDHCSSCRIRKIWSPWQCNQEVLHRYHETMEISTCHSLSSVFIRCTAILVKTAQEDNTELPLMMDDGWKKKRLNKTDFLYYFTNKDLRSKSFESLTCEQERGWWLDRADPPTVPADAAAFSFWCRTLCRARIGPGRLKNKWEQLQILKLAITSWVQYHHIEPRCRRYWTWDNQDWLLIGLKEEGTVLIQLYQICKLVPFSTWYLQSLLKKRRFRQNQQHTANAKFSAVSIRCSLAILEAFYRKRKHLTFRNENVPKMQPNKHTQWQKPRTSQK